MQNLDSSLKSRQSSNTGVHITMAFAWGRQDSPSVMHTYPGFHPCPQGKMDYFPVHFTQGVNIAWMPPSYRVLEFASFTERQSVLALWFLLQ